MAQIQTDAGALGAHTVFEPIRGMDDSRRRRWTVLGLATIGVAAIAIGGLLYVRGQTAQTSDSPAVAGGVAAEQPAYDAYAAGGSVYQQQVPAQAGTADLSAFTPGGSVYQQQVPAQSVGADSVYAPGGSVYQQQVP
jgi:hypothetical protein